MKLTGQISICRQSGPDGTKINISVTDNLSRCEVFDATMDAESFGHAVTGLSCQNVEFELRPTHAGMKRENKIEFVPRPEGYHKLPESDIVELLKDYEVDGWMAYYADVQNHHNWRPDNKVKVSFHRFVPVSPEKNKKK